jgi:hypothetical protein
VVILRVAGSESVDVSTEKEMYRLPRNEDGIPTCRVPAGKTVWLERRVIDQRVLAIAGKYRIRARAYFDGRYVWSEWVEVQVTKNAVNEGSLKPGSPEHSAYLTVIQLTDALFYRSAIGPSPDPVFGPALRSLSGIQLSTRLRELIAVLQAQQLVAGAHNSKGAEKDRMLVRVVELLSKCDSREFKGSTGGLGPEILMTEALCSYEGGKMKSSIEACEQILKRYPGSQRVPWARERIRMAKEE